MKWVNIGVAQAAGFVLIAAVADPKRAKPILAGGLLAGALMYGQYKHAHKAGIAAANDGAIGTEQSYA
jgi:hypothetical protein